MHNQDHSSSQQGRDSGTISKSKRIPLPKPLIGFNHNNQNNTLPLTNQLPSSNFQQQIQLQNQNMFQFPQQQMQIPSLQSQFGQNNNFQQSQIYNNPTNWFATQENSNFNFDNSQQQAQGWYHQNQAINSCQFQEPQIQQNIFIASQQNPYSNLQFNQSEQFPIQNTLQEIQIQPFEKKEEQQTMTNKQFQMLQKNQNDEAFQKQNIQNLQYSYFQLFLRDRFSSPSTNKENQKPQQSLKKQTEVGAFKIESSIQRHIRNARQEDAILFTPIKNLKPSESPVRKKEKKQNAIEAKEKSANKQNISDEKDGQKQEATQKQISSFGKSGGSKQSLKISESATLLHFKDEIRRTVEYTVTSLESKCELAIEKLRITSKQYDAIATQNKQLEEQIKDQQAIVLIFQQEQKKKLEIVEEYQKKQKQKVKFIKKEFRKQENVSRIFGFLLVLMALLLVLQKFSKQQLNEGRSICIKQQNAKLNVKPLQFEKNQEFSELPEQFLDQVIIQIIYLAALFKLEIKKRLTRLPGKQWISLMYYFIQHNFKIHQKSQFKVIFKYPTIICFQIEKQLKKTMEQNCWIQVEINLMKITENRIFIQ